VTRLDWLVLRRFTARFGVTLLVFLSLFMLVETLNTDKMKTLNSIGGPLIAALGVFLAGSRTSIMALPETVLIGTVASVIDLQLRRELTVMQAAGLSVWRLFRAPVIAMLAFAALLSIVADTSIISFNRNLFGQLASNTTDIWLEQNGDDDPYLLHASRVTSKPPAVYDVEIFLSGAAARDRVVAPSAQLSAGQWTLKNATRYRPDRPPEQLPTLEFATGTSLGDLQLLASGTQELTLGELMAAAASGIAEAKMQAETQTRLYWTFLQPIMVIGSMLIGIAAASRYRRTVRYGDTVLFALMASFAMFALSQMAIREGTSGGLAPILASLGPALVSVLIGLTALLYSQDGTI
jgi:lipopolysaccharide export system permease protein